MQAAAVQAGDRHPTWMTGPGHLLRGQKRLLPSRGGGGGNQAHSRITRPDRRFRFTDLESLNLFISSPQRRHQDFHPLIGADDPPPHIPAHPPLSAPCLVSEQLGRSHQCAHSRYVANLSPAALPLFPLSILLCPIKPSPSRSLSLPVRV